MSTTPRHPARIATILPRLALGWGLLLASQATAWGQDKAADAMFRKLDKSGDGQLSMDEATVGTRSVLERIFKEVGKRADEHVSRDEFLEAHERLHSKSASGGAKGAPAKSREAESSPAQAESTQPRDRSSPGGIGSIDANGDGGISRAEWSKFTQTFKTLDADKDNSLSADELLATGDAAALLMKLADANGDGKISRVEWTKLPQSFARLDANHDNSLDAAELEQGATAAVAGASGTASLAGGDKSGAAEGPILWRGRIEGRGQIELLVNGNYIVGREIADGGAMTSLGAGTFTMYGDGKSGNMDAVYTAGDRMGEICLGIYKLDGDKLTWCVNNRGGRPQGFTGGNGNWMLTLTRVRADEANAKESTAPKGR